MTGADLAVEAEQVARSSLEREERNRVEAKKLIESRSWRDVYPVHPAADLSPKMPVDELRKLGEDIKENGLKEPITVFRSDDDGDAKRVCILDGRNRHAAMELVGREIDAGWFKGAAERWVHNNPEAYVISKNIHRRHLTKEQQADLIVKVMSASTDFATSARSVRRDASGRVNGSTKNPLKEKVVEEAKKHGISKRTAEKAMAKAEGKVPAPRKKIEPNLPPGVIDNYPKPAVKAPAESAKPTVQPRGEGREGCTGDAHFSRNRNGEAGRQ